MKQKIQEKLHHNYPFMQQHLVHFLSDLIEKNHYYTIKQNEKISLRMTPLLQNLQQPTLNAEQNSKRQLVLYHMKHPIPSITSEQAKTEMKSLLTASEKRDMRWDQLTNLMKLAFKYRHYLHCILQNNEISPQISHQSLSIQKNGNQLHITPQSIRLNGHSIDLPSEREMARQMFQDYLQCIQSQYYSKPAIINQLIYGSQGVSFFPPRQVARSRTVSKQILRQHPAEKDIKLIRYKVKIPPHIIKCCYLEDILTSCPDIPKTFYEKEILPHFSEIQGEEFQLKRDTDVKTLTHKLFPPHSKQCLKYIVYEFENQENTKEYVLEIHIHCQVKIRNVYYDGLFSIRFYSEFMEFTETTFRKNTGAIVTQMEGDNCFLQYNKTEMDEFLGWGIEQEQQVNVYQRLKQQVISTSILPESATLSAKKIVYLLQNSLKVQKTKRNISQSQTVPLSMWTVNQQQTQRAEIVPSLS